MSWSIAVNLIVLVFNGATVATIFWGTRMQRRVQETQNGVNRAQAQVIHVMHARIANLERRVLSEEELSEARNVH